MESYDKKLMFIALRADNISLAKIANDLGISKRTCSVWNKELNQQVLEERTKRQNECKELYSIQREARIKRLTETLIRIDQELMKKDFSEISAENLLKLKLRYETELAKNNSNGSEVSISGGSVDTIKQAISEIHEMIGKGYISAGEAKLQLETIRTMMQANKHDTEW